MDFSPAMYSLDFGQSSLVKALSTLFICPSVLTFLGHSFSTSLPLDKNLLEQNLYRNM